MRSLILFSVLFLSVSLASAQVARVQIIHNAPSPTVDIYVNNTILLNDFKFRKATQFFDVTADVQINVSVAPGNSNSAADAIATFPLTFESGKKYVIMAAGLVGGTPGFNLYVKQDARETSADSNTVDLAVFHGSPDAPNVDVYEFYNPAKLVSNLGFGSFTNYLSLPTGIYDLKIEQAGTISSFAPHFRADLRNLGGGAATVFASGFYTSNNPEFGLYAALPDGTVIPLPSTPFAEVQIIHNAPEPTVDLYLNNTIKISDFNFREAVGFTEIPAERALKVSVAPAPSNSSAEAIANFDYNLEKNKAYCIVAAGVPGNTGNTAFNLFVKPNAKTTSNSAGNISVQVFHGSPDAPEVDVVLPNGTLLFDNLSFGEFSDYLTVPAGNYTLYITAADDNTQVLAAYLLENTPPVFPIPMNGQAVTVFASGFLGASPSFGLWLTRNYGTTYPLSFTTSAVEAGAFGAAFYLSPNPATDEISVNFDINQTETLRYQLLDFAGRILGQGDWGVVKAGRCTRNIGVSELGAGVYNLRIMAAGEAKTLRFVKQ